MPKKTSIKKLLKAAEVKIVELQEEKQNYDDFIDGLMKQQKAEAEELVRLTEQIWKLEELLENVTAEREGVRSLLTCLREDMEKIRDVAAEALRATTDKKSIMNMAVKFYDVKTLADSVSFIKDK